MGAFLNALSVLSKSSPQAVEVERAEEAKSQYKEYLYIETSIEIDFKVNLDSLQRGEILFLCGSSGDGKSAIMARYSQESRYSKVAFHLDATHSFTPDQTAIQALDERFSQFKGGNKSLVVGINVGMLGNYAEEGSDQHADIKASIKAFLQNQFAEISVNHKFLDFEHYPKFTFDYEANTSEFAAKLLGKLTKAEADNPFYELYLAEIKSQGHTRLTTNFALLGLESVQNNIIALLLKARLIKDQFLTARALLDFIFQILTSELYLFDSLFSGADNELLEQIQSFDPGNIHTRKIDEFILQFGLGIEDEGFTELKTQVKKLGVYEVSTAASYLRLVYLLKDEEQYSNDYINTLKADFENSVVEQYASVWLQQKEFDGSGKQKKGLNKFYKETLIAAIHRYCNRNAPLLDKDAFLISEFNGYKTAVELEVKPDFLAIQEASTGKIGAFNAWIQVDGRSLLPIPVSINLLELLQKINQGYRPNKHDKNAVLLLDEVIEQLITVANEKETLFILKADKRYKIVNEDDEYFEVSGL